MVFLIVAAITSIGMYNSAYFAGKMQGIDEVRRIRGYYADSAGFSYASVILKGSVTCPLTKHVRTDYYPQLWNDLGLTGSEDVIINITNPHGGGYDVKSTFTFLAENISVSGFVPKPISGFPRTGQTTTYATYDDGYYHKGMPASGTRYQDNGNGTITDNATGLMWVKDPSLCGGPIYNSQNKWASALNTPRTMTWADAITNCEALSYAGHTNWRLPNIKELQSIVNYGKTMPAIGESTSESPWVNTQGVTGYDNGCYWSGTNYAYDTQYTWFINFTSGNIWMGDKTAGAYVRPVRGGR